MQVRMTTAHRFSPDGVTIINIPEGVVDLPDQLAARVVARGVAEPLQDAKALPAAPENKAAQAPAPAAASRRRTTRK